MTTLSFIIQGATIRHRAWSLREYGMRACGGAMMRRGRF